MTIPPITPFHAILARLEGQLPFRCLIVEPVALLHENLFYDVCKEMGAFLESGRECTQYVKALAPQEFTFSGSNRPKI